jgi:gamma-glutamyl-gamma-aminobutyrate hydrolase PuuD
MSATSDEGFPTRGREIELLAHALRRRLPALGVSLGAQLLAVAFFRDWDFMLWFEQT